MSQIREQFEARFPIPTGVAWSDEHQNYGWVKKSAFQKTITYRALFTGWKASRESLVIELPAYEIDVNPDDDDYELMEQQEALSMLEHHVIGKCRKSIEAAGLKVAP